MLERLLAELAAVSPLQEAGGVVQFESKLIEIATLKDPKCISPLLGLLTDNPKLDQINFSIVHLVEKFSDDDYIQTFMNNAAELQARSPRWMSILLMRILNSPASMADFVRRIQAANESQKLAVRNALSTVCLRFPQFSERAALVQLNL